MALHQRDRLSEDVVAGPDQVNIEHGMVSDDAEHSLVVVGGCLWGESNDDTRLRLCVYCALDLRERKYVLVISEELESGWQIAVVADIQQPVGVAAQLHFSKMHALNT